MTRHRQAVAFDYRLRSWTVLDEAVVADFERIANQSKGQVQSISSSLDQRRWIASPELERHALARMHSAVVRSRDSWGYHPVHQLLANRGHAVVSVNYRGSHGFGKAFVNAGDREWAGKMHDDLIDVVDWAVDQKIADRERVAIMGDSYGGYATLVGLTFTPEVFACGVDIVGPSNLNTLLDTIPPYWKPMLALLRARIGDNSTVEGRRFLAERSPLSRVDRVVRPLLIGQGANDPRVKQAESDQIVQAMTRRGIPVTCLLYPDEGHGFVRPENNLSCMAVAEAFLARCLGGRYQPVGDDFTGSSIELVAGAEQIPGLEQDR